MLLDSEFDFNILTYVFSVVVCVLACLFWLLYGRNLAANYSSVYSSNENFPLDFMGRSNEKAKEMTESEAKTEICSSLSCIRCSKSIYSLPVLLEKWSKIERAFLPDKNTCSRIENGILNTSKRQKEDRQRLQGSTVFHLEELPSQIWYTNEEFPQEVSILENKISLATFLDEFANIYQDLQVGWVSNKVPSGGWYLFYLINQGVRIKENCSKCPKVVEIVDQLQSAMLDCAFGNIVFSVLLPGTRISRHCGPTNARIRCHVPLRAPSGYFISVAGKEHSWCQDKVLIFDDSFYHEVYCRGYNTEPRVVLMIDMWHPLLSFDERELIKQLFSPHS